MFAACVRMRNRYKGACVEVGGGGTGGAAGGRGDGGEGGGARGVIQGLGFRI